MTTKNAWIGGHVKTYDNMDIYPTDSAPIQGLRVDQGRVDVAPTEDYHIVRKSDLPSLTGVPRVVQVADISNPVEFQAEGDGDFPGQIGIAYSNSAYTQYVWIPISGDDSLPYLISTDNGLWIASSGQYSQGSQTVAESMAFLGGVAIAAQANVESLIGSTGATLPTIAAGPAAGSSPTVSILGRDAVGGISITPGSSPLGTAGLLATITLGYPLPSGYSCYPLIIAKNSNAHALDANHFCAPVSDGISGWHLNAGVSALTQGSTYVWDYFCISLKN